MLCLRSKTILVGRRMDAVHDAAILIDQGRIVDLGDAAAMQVPEGSHIVDLGDATVMPGMIDAHMHTFGVDSMRLHTLGTEHESYRAARALSELRELLLAGFTSARCLGSSIGPQLRRAIDEGLCVGPRLKTAGAFISSTSGTWDASGTPLAAAQASGELADGSNELRRAVRARVRAGADFIKLGLSKGRVHDRYHAWGDDPLTQVAAYSLEEVRAAVDEAHRNGLKVSAHAIGEVAVRLALDGGVDIIEHGYSISEETRARLISERKIVVTTLSQVQYHRKAYDRFSYPQWEREVYERHWNIMTRDFQLGLAAGIRFAFGTDMIGAPTHPLKEAGTEFVLATELGMPVRDALIAGTMIAAEALGISNETGSIDRGNRADLVAFPRNPLNDISVVKQPIFVMKDGVVFSPSDI